MKNTNVAPFPFYFSKAVVAFLSFLVQDGVFDKINYSFLVVGHTHEDIDQYFSIISRHFNALGNSHHTNRQVISFEDFAEEVKRAFRQAKEGGIDYRPQVW